MTPRTRLVMIPGKINPVIPEFLIQLAMQVTGHHVACASALDHGELDLNVWEGIILFNILDSMQLLTNAVSVLEEKCLRGLEVAAERNARNANSLGPRLTRLAQQYGYAHISGLCRTAGGDLDVLQRLLPAED